jgi:hypothetical protein
MAWHFHRFPTCPATGKRRLGERKDVKLALRAARFARSAAQVIGATSVRAEIRGYRCRACRGWHLTSREQSVDRRQPADPPDNRDHPVNNHRRK